MAGTKKTTKKAPTKRGRKKTVTLTVNEYDIPMLAIQTKVRPVYISVKKALAILATENDATLKEEVHKHGRDMFKISYGDGKSFVVGPNKINAVVEAKTLIEKEVA